MSYMYEVTVDKTGEDLAGFNYAKAAVDYCADWGTTERPLRVTIAGTLEEDPYPFLLSTDERLWTEGALKQWVLKQTGYLPW